MLAVRYIWKKRYYDEKKKAVPKEDRCKKLRQELEQLHRRITGQLEVAKDTGRRPVAPGDKTYEKALLKIKATKHEQEIEQLHHRLQNAKVRLTTEIKVKITDP